MTEQTENRPDNSPLPILLFLAMFAVYAVGTCVGLVSAGAFGWDAIALGLILGTVLFIVTLFLSLIAIRMIASGTQRIAGILWYLVCIFFCLILGVFVVPLLVVSFI